MTPLDGSVRQRVIALVEGEELSASDACLRYGVQNSTAKARTHKYWTDGQDGKAPTNKFMTRIQSNSNELKIHYIYQHLGGLYYHHILKHVMVLCVRLVYPYGLIPFQEDHNSVTILAQIKNGYLCLRYCLATTTP
jgi:hypothetical protein